MHIFRECHKFLQNLHQFSINNKVQYQIPIPLITKELKSKNHSYLKTNLSLLEAAETRMELKDQNLFLNSLSWRPMRLQLLQWIWLSVESRQNLAQLLEVGVEFVLQSYRCTPEMQRFFISKYNNDNNSTF